MATLKLDCPHCNSASMTFVSIATHQEAGTDHVWTFWRCNGCPKAILVKAEKPPKAGSAGSSMRDHTAENIGGDYVAWAKFKILESWPPAPTTEAPAHTPKNVATAFTQAVKALQGGLWDPAGMAFRRALDIGTIELAKQLKVTFSDPKLSLKRRIDELGTKAQLPQTLVDWAHAIREDGNDAAHEPMPYTEPEAKQLHEFTKTFLEYVFMLPGELAARKTATTPPSAGTP
jgi:hypothetical protein